MLGINHFAMVIGDPSLSIVVATKVEGRSVVWANMSKTLSAEQNSEVISPLLCDFTCVSSDCLILFNYFSHRLHFLLCNFKCLLRLLDVAPFLFTLVAFLTVWFHVSPQISHVAQLLFTLVAFITKGSIAYWASYTSAHWLKLWVWCLLKEKSNQ